MSAKVQIVERDGQKHEVHSVKAKNGKVGTIEVPYATTLEGLGDIIADGLDNEAHIAACYRAHFAVERQAAFRLRIEGGKVPKAERNRIFATMPDDINALAKMPDGLDQIEKRIQEIWDAEQSDAGE